MADWGWAVGLRLSEILALNPYQLLALHPDGDSPFAQQAVEVVGKGRTTRNVAVPNWLIADTLRYIDGERTQALRVSGKKRGQTPKVLFVAGMRAPKPGTPLSARRFETIVERACITAGLVRLKRRTDPETALTTEVQVANHCVHDLRHTYAVYTYWVEAQNGNSEPWKVVQAQLGHASLETTVQTYLRFVQLFGPRGRRDIRSLAGLDDAHD